MYSCNPTIAEIRICVRIGALLWFGQSSTLGLILTSQDTQSSWMDWFNLSALEQFYRRS